MMDSSSRNRSASQVLWTGAVLARRLLRSTDVCLYSESAPSLTRLISLVVCS